MLVLQLSPLSRRCKFDSKSCWPILLTSHSVLIVVVISLTEISLQNRAEAARYGGYFAVAVKLSGLFFAPMLGVLSDGKGRKLILGVGLFASAISWFLIAMRPSLQTMYLAAVMLGS